MLSAIPGVWATLVNRKWFFKKPTAAKNINWWRIVWRFLKKWKTELPYDLAIPLPDTYPQKTKTNSRRYTHPNVHSSTVIIQLPRQESYRSVHQQRSGSRRCGIYYICNGILLSHRKEQNFATCSNMNEPGGHHSKQNKSEKSNTLWYHV